MGTEGWQDSCVIRVHLDPFPLNSEWGLFMESIELMEERVHSVQWESGCLVASKLLASERKSLAGASLTSILIFRVVLSEPAETEKCSEFPQFTLRIRSARPHPPGG